MKRRPDAASHADRASAAGEPNSALLSMMGGGSPNGSDDSLGERMNARMSHVQERSQAQIPQAEQEADRLSASVTGGSPEEVKAEMGL